MFKKSKKFKAPKWFQDLFGEAKEEEEDLFEYLSGVIGYGPEWCKQNVGKCLEKLKPQERIDSIAQLNKAGVAVKYAWSRFFYENWNDIKDLVSVKPPEYDSKNKIIEFNNINIFDRFSEKFNNLKKKVKKNLNS